ncbi:MAG: hypothetical protein PHN63_00815 [Candidatus Omnitrophica bacterium]|nr:hypothetical protein [Candidatus Omnitrophota bacterium]
MTIVSGAYSETTPAQTSEGKTITALKVKNNRAISTEIVLSKIRTKIGDRYSQEVLNDDLKNCSLPSISWISR